MPTPDLWREFSHDPRHRESNRRRIVAKHEKAVAKAQKRLAIEQQKRNELGGPTA